jgi:hypothetical protein
LHLARALAAGAASPFDDLITLADSADAVVAAINAQQTRESTRAHAGAR